jgi:hypothetical protein
MHRKNVKFEQNSNQKTFGRPTHRCEDSTKICFKEIGCEDVDLFQVTGFCEYGNVPSGCIKCLEFLELLSSKLV